MRLAAANDILKRLGYQPIDARQLAALLQTLPAYPAWLRECADHERDAAAWESLRAAQFAVSAACAAALARAGVRAPLEKVIAEVVANRPVRAALARLYKTPDDQPPPNADLVVVRGALLDGRAQPAREVAASPPPDRSAWPVHKIHGARFAVTVERTTDRAGRAALQIEAAERVPNSRLWDWPNKIIVQLKDPEVIELLGVLQGRRPRAVFAHHGPHRDKSIELAAQPQTRNWLLAVRQGDIARAVPVPASHAFSISALALQVLQANAPGLSASDVMALVGSNPFSASS